MRDTQYRTAQKATLLKVVDDLVSSTRSHTGRISESEFTKVLNILLRCLAVTFSKAKKKLYPAIALANPFSCFANQVHSFRIFSTSSIHHVEKQHRTSTTCFHKSNTKFRWCNNHKSNTNDRSTKKWVHSFTQTNWFSGLRDGNLADLAGYSG
jgi:hypothetical protein